MSDESLPGDELVSAYLDGEATTAEIAEIERDGALMARVEQLRSVRDAVAAVVVPPSAEQRDRMISAALAVADAEAAPRQRAEFVPIHRRHQTLLALAAAAVLVAAVVSASLIASQGSDDAEVALEAQAVSDDAGDPLPAPTTVSATPAEVDQATAAESAAADMAEEELMPAEEPLAADESMPADAMAAEAVASAAPESAATELESAMAAPEPETAESADDAAYGAAEEPAEAAAPTTTFLDGADQLVNQGSLSDAALAPRVADLGAFGDLESLLDSIEARWSAGREDGTTVEDGMIAEDGTMVDSGMCSAVVHERAFELSEATIQSFVATVGVEDPFTIDGRFARRADGTALIVYAAPPECETEIHALDESAGP